MQLLLAVLLSPLFAAADPDELPTALTLSEWAEPEQEDSGAVPAKPRRDSKLSMSAGVRGQWSVPFGAASRDIAFISSSVGGATIAIDSHVSWSDLFNPGWGAGLTIDLTTWKIGKGSSSGFGKSSGKVAVGGYLSVSENHYDGNATEDDFGNFIRPEEMTLNTAIVGAMVFQDLGDGAFADGRLGLGVAHYSECNATYRSPPQPEFHGNLYDETWTLAMELRGSVGFQFGPLAFSIGLGFKFLFPPHEADGVDLDPGLFWTFDVDLGLDIGF